MTFAVDLKKKCYLVFDLNVGTFTIITIILLLTFLNINTIYWVQMNHLEIKQLRKELKMLHILSYNKNKTNNCSQDILNKLKLCVEHQEIGDNSTVDDDDRVQRHHRLRRRFEQYSGGDRVKQTIVAAHFNGDSSKYVYGEHQHYQGNGRLAQTNGLYIDWISSHWMRMLQTESLFPLHNGVVTIQETGLYFIYAQIYYLDEHDTNGYRIYKNEDIIAQCTTMTHSEIRFIKGNTCYTATLQYLYNGDKVTIRDIENMRYSLFESGKSFFGLFKII